jgi:soluble lytic murein transglycosylase-like protein
MGRSQAFLALVVASLATGGSLWLEAAPIAPQTASLQLPAANVSALESTPAPTPQTDPAELQVLHFLKQRHTGLAASEHNGLAEVIVREARTHGLDPALVLAVIQIESNGYTFAVSKVGAHGLMQIMPATGAELAKKHGIPWHGPTTLFDPAINVRLGIAYLKRLADRYDGDIATALAAYNWGPGRIDGELRRGNAIPTRYAHDVLEVHAASGAATASS